MTLSLEAQKVFESLDEETRKTIQKGFPFRKIRNEAIVALGKAGVNGKLISELSGISTSSVSRILGTGGNAGLRINRRGVQREREMWFLKQQLDLVYKRYRGFILARDRKEGEKGRDGRGKKT